MAKAETVTIYTIAKETDVSISTVSRILNNTFRGDEEVRRRVLDAIERHGYQPSQAARVLSGKKVSTHLVGLVAPFFINPFFVEVLKGIYGMLHAEGYHLILYDVDSKLLKKKMFETIAKEALLDGLLLVNVHLNRDEYDRISRSIPLVLVAAETDFADSVLVDNYKGIVLAMQYLHELGHRDVGFINYEKNILESRVREQAFRDQAQLLGFRFKIDYRSVDRRSGYLAAKNLLENNPEITCLLYYSDLLAFGGLDYIKESRRDGTVSIIGFDGFEMTFQTRLTTIVQPMEDMGSQGASLLLDRIKNGSKERRRIVLDPWLYKGETCTRAAGNSEH